MLLLVRAAAAALTAGGRREGGRGRRALDGLSSADPDPPVVGVRGGAERGAGEVGAVLPSVKEEEVAEGGEGEAGVWLAGPPLLLLRAG